jgi:hypothetical protein
MAASANSAHASTTITAATVMGNTSFTPSSNVTVSVATDSAGTTYSARAKHQKGDRTVGCLSGDAKIYYTTVSNVTDSSNLSTATTDNYQGWSTL